jgi:mannan endo-1,4-beta-mannosidase
LSVGDEGFFCRPQSKWTLTKKYGASGYGAGFGEDCKDGIDTVELASLPGIDLMSMHLYPDSWKVTNDWGTGWITEHAAAAQRIGKPVYLGEFGITDKATRLPTYNTWLRTIRHTGVDGALYWMLASTQDDGTLYSDYDGYTVYCPSPVCSLITAQAKLVPAWSASPRTLLLAIADNDTLALQRGETGSVNIVANDISLSLPIRPRSLDLDPSTTGRQLARTLPGGTLTAADDGTVTFVADPDFTGKVTFPYSISNGVTRSTANLVVTVRPKPGDPVVLDSWEDGVDGWAGANWQSDPGTLTTGANGTTNGSSALQIASKGAWFGSPAQDPVLDLSARTSIEFDLTTADTGTSVSVAVRNGSDWTWCQSSWTWVPAGTSQTVKVPLDTFGCDASGLTAVHDVLIYFSAGNYAVDRLTLS